ncbi:MAG: hypothetical protein IJF67_15830, partial [Clostridia bacterium]|nr:hypothetical protein [Clostridia bacterium]
PTKSVIIPTEIAADIPTETPINNDIGNAIANVSVQTVIGHMKRVVSKEIGTSVWQRSFHDHIIRNRRDYEMIAKYIAENPIHWEDDCFFPK